MARRPVSLSPAAASPLADRAAGLGHDAARDVTAALRVAGELGELTPVPADGATRVRWEVLASLAAADLTVARVVEPHLDAVAILAEADADGLTPPVLPAGATAGVFASQAPPTDLVLADERVSGTKAWCSLADRLSHALVSVSTVSGQMLVLLDLRSDGVEVDAASGWVPHGLPEVTSTPIRLHDVPVVPVGPPDWYLERPGFWWGGIGVAACWYGGAVALGRTAHASAHRRGDAITDVQLARIDLALEAARLALAAAADRADDAAIEPADVARLAGRVRAICAATAETVLGEAGHLLGPGPLAFDRDHAQRVADLTLYVRQHHADRDLAGLGGELRAAPEPPW